ncbi:hypothetical protein GCM10023331_34140 [Algivirga pacifica]|uniref:Serine phosphatase RsbU, regulator of sigma subunit n=2 Tax=Algivirga pacifica TaxID=1162670 RepID=A0ABP9DKY2_9BACT
MMWGSHCSFGQNHQTEVEALKKELRGVLDNRERVDILNRLANMAKDANDINQTLKYAGEALKLANQIYYKQGAGYALIQHCFVYRLKREFQKGLDYGFQAATNFEEEQDHLGMFYAYSELYTLYQDWNAGPGTIQYLEKALQAAEALNDEQKINQMHQLLGSANQREGKFLKSLEYFEKYKNYVKKKGEMGQYTTTLAHMANIYNSNLRSYGKALEYNLEILRIKSEQEDKVAMASFMNDVGYLYEKLGNFEMALKYFKNAVELNNELNKNEKENIPLLKNIGTIYLNGYRNIPKAIRVYEDAVDVAERLGSYTQIAQMYRGLGVAYQSDRRFSTADKSYEKAIQFAKKAQDRDVLVLCYNSRIDLAEQTGSYKRALQLSNALTALKDQILREERQKLEEEKRNFNAARQKQEQLEKKLEARKEEEQRLRDQEQQARLRIMKMKQEQKSKEYELVKEQAEKKEAENELLLAKQELANKLEQEKLDKIRKEKQENDLLINQERSQRKNLDNQILLQKKANKLLEDKIEEERRTKNFAYIALASIFFGLIGMVIFLIINRNKNRRLTKQNKEILTQKQEIEQQRDQIALAKKEVENVNDDFQQLSEFGQKITATMDFNSINWTAFGFANAQMDAAIFGIGTFDNQSNLLEFKSLLENGENKPRFRFKLSQTNSLAVLCLKSQEEIIINDFDKEIGLYIQEEISFPYEERPKSLVYIPLTAEQKTLGVLTVQSFEKSAYTRQSINILRSMASYISIALTNADAYGVINLKNKHITDSMRYAQTIQRSILPAAGKIKRDLHLDTFILFKPKDIVSGDYYWYSKIDRDELNRKNLANPFTDSLTFMAVIDCTGHGVPGGFMSMVGNTLLNEIINQKHIYAPAQILEKLNEGIIRALHQETKINDDGMDITLCVIEKTKDNKTKVYFSGAKRPLWYIPNKEEKIIEIKGTNKAIGGMWAHKKDRDFEEHTLELERGSTLYLVTDGYADQNNAEGKKFGKLKMIKTLEKIAPLNMMDQKDKLEEVLDKHQGNVSQRDDITVVGIKLI